MKKLTKYMYSYGVDASFDYNIKDGYSNQIWKSR